MDILFCLIAYSQVTFHTKMADTEDPKQLSLFINFKMFYFLNCGHSTLAHLYSRKTNDNFNREKRNSLYSIDQRKVSRVPL